MGLLETKCRRRAFIGSRPLDVPDGWIVYNAPRPITGQMKWISDFYAGAFYVAVDPAHEQAEEWDTRNAELDATVLVYFTDAEAIDAVTQYCEREYGVDWGSFPGAVTNMSKTAYVHQFLDLVHEGEIEL